MRGFAFILFCLVVMAEARHQRRQSLRRPRTSVAMLGEQRKVRKFYTERENLAAQMLAEARKSAKMGHQQMETFEHTRQKYMDASATKPTTAFAKVHTYYIPMLMDIVQCHACLKVGKYGSESCKLLCMELWE
eukprot:gnl/MRDRNA2_/MRDRNA2_89178_c0_seq1.p1 gnl/MRDRNA2_/MRDRNA2_89178_c0~~gnl/MRDRNA2_/MRDRNA2_89178_c0_seq1.p1  ORF type:complete len:133 (+),score=25.34 gnl/MRDRNA2_/MRDRNA2_89178_c0_seq1:81-479(+)